MRNWSCCCGVYPNMLRWPILLIMPLAAVALQPPQLEPMDAALQAIYQNPDGGHADPARREAVRALLQKAAVDSPRFPGWAQQVSGLYQNSGWSAHARAVLLEALSRTAPLGDAHPSHIAMLSALAESWQQDGNLLKAVTYLEQAATALEAAPPADTEPPPARQATRAVLINGSFSSGGFYFAGSLNDIYFRLANLYQQLGQPNSVTMVAARLRTAAAQDQWALARFYEQHGQLPEAEAVYQKLAESASSPQAAATGWQALANLQGREEKFDDAVSSMRQAIAATQSAARPGIPDQTIWMQQALAGFLQQAGHKDQADQIYQQLLRDNPSGQTQFQVLNSYTQYLSNTGRGSQAEGVWKGFLADNPDLDPPQKMNALNQLAFVAQRSGNSKDAAEYRKAAQALQPQVQPDAVRTAQSHIGEVSQQARLAASEHRLDDAYNLAIKAIEAAPQAGDGNQLGWFVPQIAQILASNKEPAKAEQLFQRAFSVEQSGSVDQQALTVLAQGYARFLMSQKDRVGDVPAAIEKYRDALIDANGAESATLVQPLRMTIEFEQSQEEWQKADAAARELLKMQLLFSGDSSQPYLQDLQTAARAYEAGKDYASALPLRRKAIAIADLFANPRNNDWQRCQTRMDAALDLAHMKQFDEAIDLGEKAIDLDRVNKNQNSQFVRQLAQIREMATASAKNK